MFYHKFFCQTIQCPNKEGGHSVSSLESIHNHSKKIDFVIWWIQLYFLLIHHIWWLEEKTLG